LTLESRELAWLSGAQSAVVSPDHANYIAYLLGLTNNLEAWDRLSGSLGINSQATSFFIKGLIQKGHEESLDIMLDKLRNARFNDLDFLFSSCEEGALLSPSENVRQMLTKFFGSSKQFLWNNLSFDAEQTSSNLIMCGDDVYIRHAVDRNGDRGYSAFGIDREQAYRYLIENIYTIKDILKAIINETLLTNEAFITSLQGFDGAKKDAEKYYAALRRQDADLEEYENNLLRHANNLTLISAYIDYDVKDKKIDDGWCHPLILYALAQIRGVHLHLYVIGDNGKMVPHRLYPEHHPVDAKDSAKLLFINGNHFERLELSLELATQLVSSQHRDQSDPQISKKSQFFKQDPATRKFALTPEKQVTLLRNCALSPNPLHLKLFSQGRYEEVQSNLAFMVGLISSNNIPLANFLRQQCPFNLRQSYVNAGVTLYEQPDKHFFHFDFLAANADYPIISIESARNTDPNFSNTNMNIYTFNLLQLAAGIGTVSFLKLLLENQPEIDFRFDHLAEAPLCIALSLGHLAVADYLCEKQIVPKNENVICQHTQTNPLHYLCKLDILEIVHYPHLFKYFKQVLILKDANSQLLISQNETRLTIHVGSRGTTIAIRYRPINYACAHGQIFTLKWIRRQLIQINEGIGFYSLVPFLSGSVEKTFQNRSSLRYSFPRSLRNLQLPGYQNTEGFNNELYHFVSHQAFNHSLPERAYPEYCHFLVDSINYIIELYSLELNLREFFLRLHDHRSIESCMITFGIKYFDKIILPLIQAAKKRNEALFFDDQPHIVINTQNDLLRAYHAKYKVAVESTTNNVFHFYLDLFLSFPDYIPCSIISRLIMSCSDEELNQIIDNDKLRRNPICLLIDQYLEEPKSDGVQIPKNDYLQILNTLAKCKLNMDISDGHGASALIRIKANGQDEKLFQIFEAQIIQNFTYYSQYFAPALPDSPFESDDAESDDAESDDAESDYAESDEAESDDMSVSPRM